MFYVLLIIYSTATGDISSFTDPRIFYSQPACYAAAGKHSVEMKADPKYKKAKWVCYGRNFLEDFR